MSIYACLPRKDRWRQEGVPVNPPPPRRRSVSLQISHTHTRTNTIIIMSYNTIIIYVAGITRRQFTCRKRITWWRLRWMQQLPDTLYLQWPDDLYQSTADTIHDAYTHTLRLYFVYLLILCVVIIIHNITILWYYNNKLGKVSLLLSGRRYVSVKVPESSSKSLTPEQRVRLLRAPRNPWASLICISVPAETLPARSPRSPAPLPLTSTVYRVGTSPFIIITRLFITLCKYNADGYHYYNTSSSPSSPPRKRDTMTFLTRKKNNTSTSLNGSVHGAKDVLNYHTI